MATPHSLPFYIKTVSPVHIGCDEVYEPMASVIDESTKRLIAFQLDELLATMKQTDRDAFTTLCRMGTISSIVDMYKFFRRYHKANGIVGREVEACSGLISHYERTVNMQTRYERDVTQNLNKFLISRTSFLSHSQAPYLPGTSVKGAIRTAYLNYLYKAKTKNLPPEEQRRYGRSFRNSKDLEKDLLQGSFDTDPLRMLKVSDFMPVGNVKTRIVYAVNEKKAPSEHQAQGPYQILEVIEPGARFKGMITLNQPLAHAGIQRPLTWDTLQRSITQFFSTEKTHEEVILGNMGLQPQTTPPKPGAFLARIGRHSGAEAMTIEGVRDIKIMQGRGDRPKFEDHSTTLWLAAESSNDYAKQGLQPFGWVRMGELTSELESEFTAIEDRHKAESQAQPKKTVPTASVRQAAAAPKEDVWSKVRLFWTGNTSTLTGRDTGNREIGRATGADLLSTLKGMTDALKTRLTSKKGIKNGVDAWVVIDGGVITKVSETKP